MNEKTAKRLRQMARQEMAHDGAPVRELVARQSNPTTAVNHPITVRGLYRSLKKAHRAANNIR